MKLLLIGHAGGYTVNDEAISGKHARCSRRTRSNPFMHTFIHLPEIYWVEYGRQNTVCGTNHFQSLAEPDVV